MIYLHFVNELGGSAALRHRVLYVVALGRWSFGLQVFGTIRLWNLVNEFKSESTIATFQ